MSGWTRLANDPETLVAEVLKGWRSHRRWRSRRPTGGIGPCILDGSRPPCACFGSRSNRPLGPIHVLRNVGLIALATVAAVWG